MAKSFLELVNDAIVESKATLDPLTADNFANPPRTHLYNRFKDWINRSYKELMIKRNEWYIRNERAVLEIWPRVHISNATYSPAPGDVLRGVLSGVEMTVKSVHTYEQAQIGGVAEYTLSVSFATPFTLNDLVINESIEQLSPVPTTNVGKIKGHGFYDFKDMVPQMQRMDHNAVTVMTHPSNMTELSATNTTDARPLVFIPWDRWITEYAMYTWAGNMPEYITQTPLGTYDFYPKPDKNYLLNITYSRSPKKLINPGDVPEALPEEYEDYLMWRAIEEYADYDSNTRLYARAHKHVEEYLYWLERDQMPDVTFGRNKFYDYYPY